MPGAIPARHLVIEIADFHNKIGPERTLSALLRPAARLPRLCRKLKPRGLGSTTPLQAWIGRRA